MKTVVAILSLSLAAAVSTGDKHKTGAPFPHCYPCGSVVAQIPYPDPDSPYPPMLAELHVPIIIDGVTA